MAGDRTKAGTARDRSAVDRREMRRTIQELLTALPADARGWINAAAVSDVSTVAAAVAVAAADVSDLDASLTTLSAAMPTNVVLGSDFATSSTTAVDVTGLKFTPAAGRTYEITGVLCVRTNNALLGPRPGLAWPATLTKGVAIVRLDGTSALGNSAAPILLAASVLPGTAIVPVIVEGLLVAGGSPSGDFRVQLAASATTTATIEAGSFLRYRVVA